MDLTKFSESNSQRQNNWEQADWVWMKTSMPPNRKRAMFVGIIAAFRIGTLFFYCIESF
jgi:hypothetical protein